MKDVSERERLFCKYYAETRNAREAAARAGFTVLPGKAAARLLAKQSIRRELAKNNADTASRAEVCAGYRRLAFGSVADAVGLLLSEEPIEARELDRLELFNISEIKRPKGGGMEIKFFDRQKALDRLREISSEASGDIAAQPFFEALERGAKALNNSEKGSFTSD